MDPDDDKLMRMKGVAAMLGISRHTVGRLVKNDRTFPRFVNITPGIKVMRAREVRAWLRRKELAAYEGSAPPATKRPK